MRYASAHLPHVRRSGIVLSAATMRMQECKMDHHMRKLVLALTLLAWAAPALAQQRPLDTQDPETIGAGRVLVEGGISASHDITYPLSGFKGDLWQVPVLGINV